MNMKVHGGVNQKLELGKLKLKAMREAKNLGFLTLFANKIS